MAKHEQEHESQHPQASHHPQAHQPSGEGREQAGRLRRGMQAMGDVESGLMSFVGNTLSDTVRAGGQVANTLIDTVDDVASHAGRVALGAVSGVFGAMRGMMSGKMTSSGEARQDRQAEERRFH